jgi:hypothetical protein
VSLEGTTLGIDHLGPELGRGGMGTVYRAESTAAGAAGDAAGEQEETTEQTTHLRHPTPESRFASIRPKSV